MRHEQPERRQEEPSQASGSGEAACSGTDGSGSGAAEATDGRGDDARGPRPEATEKIVQEHLETLRSQLDASEEARRRLEHRIEALERQVEHLEGVTAVVPLLSDVSHALNNILTGAMGFTHLLNRSTLAGEPREARMLAIVNGELNRCAQMSRRLVDYARNLPRPDRERYDLGALLEELVKELEPRYREQQITIGLELPGRPVLLDGVRFHTALVLRHLVENAREAILTMGGPGWIRIRLSAGQETWNVDICDSGEGIREPGRLFEPFYSTRDAARVAGPFRGVGLAMAKGVMREHGGRIQLEPGGEGATFTLRFPRVPGDLDGAADAPAEGR